MDYKKAFDASQAIVKFISGLEATVSRALKEDPLILKNLMGKDVVVDLTDEFLHLLDTTEGRMPSLVRYFKEGVMIGGKTVFFLVGPLKCGTG